MLDVGEPDYVVDTADYVRVYIARVVVEPLGPDLVTAREDEAADCLMLLAVHPLHVLQFHAASGVE